MTRNGGERPLPGTGRPFRAPWWFSWRQAQTFGGVIAPLDLPAGMPDGSTHDVEVAPGTRVRVHVTPQPRASRGTLLLLHGLAGHAGARLIRRAEGAAWRRGWTIVRVNSRMCGGTAAMAMARTLNNAGLSRDIAGVLASSPVAPLPHPRVAIGYSLTGNVLLKYLGEAAARAPGETSPIFSTERWAADGPGAAGRHLPHAGAGSRLAAAVAISPPIDLSLTCLRLESARNAFYHYYFTGALVRLARHRHRLMGRPGPPPAFWRTPTMRRFDAQHTAPDAGYGTPEEYYTGASARYLLDRIDTPTLVLAAKDDPIMPSEMFLAGAGRNPVIRWILTDRGGHCGWIERRGVRFRSWALGASLDFLEEAATRVEDPGPRRAAEAGAPSREADATASVPAGRSLPGASRG